MASTSPTNEPKKSRFRRGSSGGATKADGASSTRGEAKEPGRSAQFRQVFETARANDPALLAWMIGAFALVFVLLLIIGFSIGHPIYLGIIAMLPLIALATIGANQNFPFGGTSILIMVGVGLETVKQIESQLQQQRYEGFLR